MNMAGKVSPGGFGIGVPHFPAAVIVTTGDLFVDHLRADFRGMAIRIVRFSERPARSLRCLHLVMLHLGLHFDPVSRQGLVLLRGFTNRRQMKSARLEMALSRPFELLDLVRCGDHSHPDQLGQAFQRDGGRVDLLPLKPCVPAPHRSHILTTWATASSTESGPW
jgi:hypothetical protein